MATNANSGIGFTGVLTIVFIVLKLTHSIDWSWIWVLCPLWIGFILGIIWWILIVLILASIKGGKRKW